MNPILKFWMFKFKLHHPSFFKLNGPKLFSLCKNILIKKMSVAYLKSFTRIFKAQQSILLELEIRISCYLKML